MLTSVQNVCVVTTFYTLESMKSILLPKFVFFRSRLRLSLKNTNLSFYWFICFLWGVALRIITYPAPFAQGSLRCGGNCAKLKLFGTTGIAGGFRKPTKKGEELLKFLALFLAQNPLRNALLKKNRNYFSKNSFFFGICNTSVT